jgi:hypothetical protein
MEPSYVNNSDVKKHKKIEWNGILPFPHKSIPMPLHIRDYFIEKFDKHIFLRHIHNPYFVKSISIKNKVIEHMNGDFNENTGEYLSTQEELILYTAEFEGKDFACGYVFLDSEFFFVNIIESEIPFDDLKLEIKIFYDSVTFSKEIIVQGAILYEKEFNGKQFKW